MLTASRIADRQNPTTSMPPHSPTLKAKTFPKARKPPIGMKVYGPQAKMVLNMETVTSGQSPPALQRRDRTHPLSPTAAARICTRLPSSKKMMI